MYTFGSSDDHEGQTETLREVENTIEEMLYTLRDLARGPDQHGRPQPTPEVIPSPAERRDTVGCEGRRSAAAPAGCP